MFLTWRNVMAGAAPNLAGMWPYHPDLLARPVPRYTSFPTAAEFGDLSGEAGLVDLLDGVRGDISLYVHLPFCQDICWYCGCNTARANRAHRLTLYLDALHAEIGLIADRLPEGVRVRRIAFGGGSPNALSPVQFVRLYDRLSTCFTLAEPVVSIELDPRGFNREWAQVIGRVGVTRASLGVQTFSPRIQMAIGRVQPLDQIAGCVQQLREAGVTSLNLDLMYGLPLQGRYDLEETLDRAIDLAPDRLALFGYAHVPHLIPRQRRIDGEALPDQAERFAMAAMGHDLLVDAGYQAVGFDHFARPDDAIAIAARTGGLRRNFQGFTEDASDVLIGLGASAITELPALLAQNDKNPAAYRERLEAGQWPVSRGIRRTAEDRAIGVVIAALLCHGRADLAPVGGPAPYRDALRPFTERLLARIEASELILTPGALPYARTIAALFDPYRPVGARQFSSAI
jgi:oxygen-independent coproporphyrinogen-3 oxidase